MNILIQELKQGEMVFSPGPIEGVLVVTNKPPTALSLRAARRIQELEAIVTGLAKANDNLMRMVSDTTVTSGPEPINIVFNKVED